MDRSSYNNLNHTFCSDFQILPLKMQWNELRYTDVGFAAFLFLYVNTCTLLTVIFSPPIKVFFWLILTTTVSCAIFAFSVRPDFFLKKKNNNELFPFHNILIHVSAYIKYLIKKITYQNNIMVKYFHLVLYSILKKLRKTSKPKYNNARLYSLLYEYNN